MRMFELSVDNVKAFDINGQLFRNYREWKTRTKKQVVARDVIGSVLLVWYIDDKHQPDA